MVIYIYIAVVNQIFLIMFKNLLIAFIAISALAACKKEEVVSLKEQKDENIIKDYDNGLQSGWENPFRKLVVTPTEAYCNSEIESCAPKDVVITAPPLDEFNNVISRGSTSVASFFQNVNKAKELIPHWEALNFKEFKAKILSGDYTFIKESFNNTVLYYLVHKDEVNTLAYEHVLLFRLQEE